MLVAGASCLVQSAPQAPGRKDDEDAGAGERIAADGRPSARAAISIESKFFEFASGLGVAGMSVKDGRAYTTSTKGLNVYGISDPARPELLGSYPLELAGYVTVVGQHAYVARGTMHGNGGNLTIVDVSEPGNMRQVGNTPLPFGAVSVVVKDDYAYLGGFDAGLFVVDVADKRAPRLVNNVTFPRIRNPIGDRLPYRILRALASKKDKQRFPYRMGRTWWLHVEGNRLYVCDENTGFYVLDLSDPADPKRVGHFLNDKTWPDGPGLQKGAANDVDVADGIAYVAVDSRGMHVLDVSGGGNPSLVAHYDPWAEYEWETAPGHMVQVVVKDGLAYLTAGEAGLYVMDVTNPADPRLLARHPIPKGVGCSWGLAVAGDHVFVTYCAFDPGAFKLGLKGGWEILKVHRQTAR